MSIKDKFDRYFATSECHALTSTRAEPDYLQAATSANTRRAYQNDICDYQDKFAGALPASSQDVVRYLKWSATRVNPNTIKRRLTSLRQWHRLQDYPDPTSHSRWRNTFLINRAEFLYSSKSHVI